MRAVTRIALMTVLSGAYVPVAATPVTITIDGARWDVRPQSMELGAGGSSWRNVYATLGASAYLWWSHAADTPSGTVQTGPDPGDFESALSGYTGYEVVLPAGNSTPEDHADLVVTALLTVPGVSAAVAAVSANVDGSWDIVLTTTLAVAAGTRAYGSRGLAGIHGGHIYRTPEAGEITGSSAIEITRPLANRINAPHVDDRIWAVGLNFDDVVSTAVNSRPRLQYWTSTSSITPDGTEMLADFDQVPASEVVAGASGYIYLTAAQCVAFRSALDGATGTNHWISAHAVSGCNYTSVPTGGGRAGEQSDESIRVEVVSSNLPTVALTEWDNAGELDFAVLMGARLVYDRDPATSGEHRVDWGSVAAYATYPGDFVLPDSVTAQRGDVTGLEGGRIRSITVGVVAGTMSLAVMTGGTQTPDAPVLLGATVVWEAGQTSTTGGDATISAPVGASTVRVPTSGGMWLSFKGFGATGRGHAGPGPFPATGDPDQPSAWVRRFDDGGLRGQNPGERDMARADYGDDETSFESPVTGITESGPGNHPRALAEIWQPALAVA